ncbi:carbohydrate ABC transporter permease [Pseudoflavonifractor sp. CLA-AP-H29]|uniref:Carbohydrate ABC transporter permease n=1 Tax=Pseudoflavonifractor intestinihominis TaxID=3133171 RepID=A0ABV1E6Y6_9FIRM
MSRQPKTNKRRAWWRIPIALVILAIFLSPFYILLSVAFRSPQNLSSYWIFPTQLHLENFQSAIQEGDILLAIFNSLIITVGAVFLVTVIGALAAYPLARRRTRLNMGIKGFALGIMMVPPLSILVSLYSVMVQLQGVNRFWGIIIILVTFELPLSIFLYTNFISSIPNALDEAAAIDGSGPVRTFFQIILPQLKPVTASVVILTGVHCWNDYQFSLYMLQSPKLRTIPLAIASYFSQTTSNVNAAAAAALLAILPIVIAFLFLQKYFIQGMVDSAIK